MPRPVHEHPLYRFSFVSRPVDPRFPSNKAILVVCVLVLVGGGVWGWIEHETVGPAALTGVTGALLAFVSWALGRELDPDVNATAFVVVASTLGAWAVFEDSGLVPLVVALATSRVVNRTVGPPAKLSDEVGVLAIIGVVVLVAGRWSLGIAGAAAFAFDAVLSNGRRRSWLFAIASLAFAAGEWVRRGTPLGPLSHPALIGALVVGFIIAVITLPAPKSSCDLPGHRLDRRRVQAGMLVTLIVALGLQLETTAELAAPTLLAVLVGTMIGRVWPRP
jgi:hypothetical protein